MAKSVEPKTPERGGVARGSPNLDITVFAGSKGGTGKTTVAFHAAGQAAKDNPEAIVLVIDCSFAGDLSERYLGGSATAEHNQTAGEAAFYRLHSEGKGANHLFRYIKENLSSDLAPPSSNKDTKEPGGLMTAWRRFSLNGSTPAPPGRADPVPADLPNIIDRFGVLVRDVNPLVTLDNLFLIPGGGSGRQPCAGLGVELDERPLMATALRAYLSSLARRRKLIVYFDTDGDLDVSTSMEVVLRTADTCALFTQSDPADFRRIRTFCADLSDLRGANTTQRGSVHCAAIAVISFNMVNPSTDLAPFEELGCMIKPHLVAVRQLISSFSNKLTAFVIGTAAVRPLFAHVPLSAPGNDEGANIAQFKRSSFMVIQEFLKLGMLGSDLGIPFCCMVDGKTYKGEHGEYKVDNPRLLEALIENIRELNGRL